MARRSSWRNSAATLALAIGLAGAAAAPAFADFQDGMAAYQAGEHGRAMELWRPLAEAGDAAAQYWVGRLFERGEGVPVSLARAAMWYRLAADQQDADALTALDDVLDTLRARETGQSGPQVADAGPAEPASAPGTVDPGADRPDVPRYAPDRDPNLDPGAAPQRDAGVGAPGTVPGRDGASAAAGTGEDSAAIAGALPPALPPRIGDSADADRPDGAPGTDGADAAAVADAGYDDAAIADGVADAEGAVGIDGPDAAAVADAGYDDAAIADAAAIDELADAVPVPGPGDEPDLAAVDGDGVGPGAGDGIDEDVLAADADAVGEAGAVGDEAVELAALEDDLIVDEPVVDDTAGATAVDPIADEVGDEAAYDPIDDMPGTDGAFDAALPPELAEAMADGALEADEIEALIEDGVVTPDMIDDLVAAGVLDSDTLAQLAEAGVLDEAALDALVDNGLIDEALVADARTALDGDATMTADGTTLLDDFVDGVTSFVDRDETATPPRRLITERR